MKKLTEWIENNRILSLLVNREVFSLCYLAVCLLLSFPLLTDVVSVVAKVCFLWGVGLIGWDLLTKRLLFRSAYWAAPLLILGGYGVSVLLNREVLVTGAKHWLHLAISLLLLYAAERDAGEKKLIGTVKRGFVIVNLITFFGSAASLVMFVLQTKTKTMAGGLTYKQGFFENRLYGVYASPNPGALFALAAVAGVVFLFLLKDGDRLKCRWFFIVNAVIQTVYFSLTLSKGGLLSAAVTAGVLFLFLVVPLVAKGRSAVKTALISVVVCALFVGVSQGAMNGIRWGMSYLPGMLTVTETPETPAEENTKRVKIERVEEGNETAMSRIVIWQGGWKLIRSHLLFGLADANAGEGAENTRFDLTDFTEQEKILLVQHNDYFHNIAIQILVHSGMVGIFLFAIFALLIVVKLMKVMLLTEKGTRTYRAIAVLAALCAGLAVNGVGESHLVFHRQDPLGLMFWFFLGVAVALADRYRKSPEGIRAGKDDRIALMASTPLQVLHCLSFTQNDCGNSRGHTDLYLAHPFQGSEEISARLKTAGIFNNVYDLDAFSPSGPVKGKLTTFYRLFLPEAALKTMARGRLPVKGYAVVAASSQTSASIALRMTYPDAAVWLYDDGVGSYFGNMAGDYNSRTFDLLNAVFFCGRLNLAPEKQFLSNPAMSRNEIAAPVEPLPTLTGESGKAAETVFGYTANDCYRGKAVYLTQPLEEWAGYRKENEAEIVRLAAETFGDRAVGRVHPRQTLTSLGGIPICGVPNLWELECVNQIGDDNILIGGFSTAQLTPKMLCGKEPTVIFTFRLLSPETKGEQAEKILRLIESFRASYRQPEKVFLPTTMEELAGILRRL